MGEGCSEKTTTVLILFSENVDHTLSTKIQYDHEYEF